MQKESTSRDSFDLFSGLFVHNRFAQQQVMGMISLSSNSIYQSSDIGFENLGAAEELRACTCFDKAKAGEQE